MLKIKKPAFSGILPSKIKWKAPSDQERNTLKQYLNFELIDNIQKKEDQISNHLLGYYRSTNKENIFFKIVDVEDNKNQDNAVLISSWLNESGFKVSCVRKGYPKEIKKYGLWIYLYEYIDHDFFDGSNESIYLIGKGLGKMHKMMIDYPLVNDIFNAGNRKNKLLLKQFKDIKDFRYIPSFPEDAISLIIKTSDEEFSSLTKNSQMIHGDMNFGNIIFEKGSVQPIFIDFEDSASSWLSPLYDIAFIIQRFLLNYQIDNSLELAKLFYKGYLSQNGISSFCSNGSLYTMLKMISIRSLLILSTLPDNEQKLYTSEVRKFINLYFDIENKENLISKIEKISFSI